MVYQPQTANLQIIPPEVAFDATAGRDLGAAEPVTAVSPVAANDGAVSSVDGAGAGFPPIDVYGESDPSALTLPVAGPPVLVGPLFDNAPAPGVGEASSDITAARPRGWLGRLVDRIVAPFAPQPRGVAPETPIDGDTATSPMDGVIDPAGNAVGASEYLVIGAEELVPGGEDRGLKLTLGLEQVFDALQPGAGHSPANPNAPKDPSGPASHNPARSSPAGDNGLALSRLSGAEEPTTPPPAVTPYSYYYGTGLVADATADEPLEPAVTVVTETMAPGPAVGLVSDSTQDDGAPATIPSPVQGIASGTEAEQGAPVAKKSLTPQTVAVEAVAAEDAPSLPGSAEPQAAGGIPLAGAEDPVDPHAGHHHGVFAGETTKSALKDAPADLQDGPDIVALAPTRGEAAIRTSTAFTGGDAAQPGVTIPEPTHAAVSDHSIPSRGSSTRVLTQGHQGSDGDERDDQADTAGLPFLLGATAFFQPGGTPHGIAVGLQPIQLGFVFIPIGAATGSPGARSHTAAARQRDQAEVGQGLARSFAIVAHKTDNPSGDRDRQGEHAEQAGIIAAFNAASPTRRRSRPTVTGQHPQAGVTSSDVFVTGLG